MEKALIVRRRTGKEHGEDLFKVNSPAVVTEHIKSQVDLLRATPDKDWRWWRLNDDVLVEIPKPSEHYKPSIRIYYQPQRHCVAIADLRFGGFRRERHAWEPELYWYVHIGTVEFNPAYGAWIGGFTYSAVWSVLFLGIGAGAIVQVIYVILRQMARQPEDAEVLTPRNVVGLLVGFMIMYATGVLVTF